MAKSNKHNAPTPIAQWTPTYTEAPTEMTKVKGKRIVRKQLSCKLDLLEEYDLTMVEVRTILGGLGYPRVAQTLENYFKEYKRKPMRHLTGSYTKTVKRKVSGATIPTTKQRQSVARKLGSTKGLSNQMIISLA